MAEREKELALDESAPEETVSEKADSANLTAEDAMTPESFDLDAWVSGLTPIRRGVTIYGRQDLCANIDVLEGRIRGFSEGSTKWRAAVKELAAAREAYEASVLEVVVRALDPDEAKKLFERIQNAESDKARQMREIEYTAAHIVEPADMDADKLRAVHEVLPREVDRITVAATMADHDALAGVTAQFRQ